MQLITLDFESHWAADYSLSKMSPLEYVMHPRFQAISVAIKYDRYPTDVFFGPDQVEKILRKIDWRDKAVLAHNMSGFDSYVMAYRYGVRPRMWMCTLAMARPIHAKDVGLSLGKLVEHYKLGKKDNAVLLNTRGKRFEDFTPDELAAMEKYNREDTDQCRALFDVLKPHYSSAELWQIDAVIRMRTEPQFELDTGLLTTAASIERDRKHKALLDLGKLLGIGGIDWSDEGQVTEQVRSELASSAKFAELLKRLGVETPMKPSPTDPTRTVPALAKTDEAFIALQEHPNDVVAAAARARLDVKSTLLETRIEKFMTAGSLAAGRLPVPIRYCGADTTGRDSGEEYNPQNLPRINPDKPKPADALRRSLRAPRGCKVGVADQSGIELRVNHFLWKVPSSMALYQGNPAKADLYRAFAAENLYRKAPEQITKPERQIGKVAQLGLGFGAGAPTFRRIAKIMGGVDIPLEPTGDGALSCVDVVGAWRSAYEEIVTGWKQCGQALTWIRDGKEYSIDPWGLTHTSRHGIHLPSGRIIRYPDLRVEDDGEWPDGRPKKSWVYAQGRHKARLTGPKVDENIVQALARDSVFDAALDFYRLTGLRPALRVHDELVYVLPEKHAEELLNKLQAILRTPPRWWPALVVWSEGDLADTYGDAK